jgi:hypothetical protein
MSCHQRIEHLIKAGVGVALAASAFSPSTVANAETWSCDYELPAGKARTQIWNVANGRMTAPNGKSYYRVTLNDDRFLMASVRLRPSSGESQCLNLLSSKRKQAPIWTSTQSS